MSQTCYSYHGTILASIVKQTSVAMTLLNVFEDQRTWQGCIYVKKLHEYVKAVNEILTAAITWFSSPH